MNTESMDPKAIAEKLMNAPGIHLAVVPDDDVLNELFAREDDIVDTTFGMPIDNRALAACRGRSKHVVIFCDYTFEVPDGHVMMMEDENGKTVGFDIPSGKAEEYIDRTDLVWLSDDFVLLTTTGSDIAKVVMLPQKARCIGEKDGVKDAVLFYPATTTDMFLKKRFGVDTDTPSIASALLSFDEL